MPRFLRFALPAALAALVLSGAGCFSLGPSPSSSTATGTNGIFQTADAGATWSASTAVPTATGVGSLAGADITALARDPQDDQTLYAGSKQNGLFYSTDGGVSWKRPRLDALRDGAVASVAVDPSSTCTVYAAKGPRIFKTTDCLRSFAADAFVETRANVSVTDVRVDWYDPKTVWVGESDGGVQKSTDAGKTWRRVLSAFAPVSAVLVSQQDSRIVLAATQGNGFYRTTDGGADWTQIRDQLKNLRGADTVFALAQDAKGSVIVASTQYGLVRSLDQGANWEGVPLLTAPGQVAIRALAVGPSSGNVIAYATSGTFYRSTDGGRQWATHALPSGHAPSVLAADPAQAMEYFLGFMTPPPS